LINKTLRLRVFAGPNGSGKSTIINSVKDHEVNGKKVDFGYYINADELLKKLSKSPIFFSDFNIITTRNEFIGIATESLQNRG